MTTSILDRALPNRRFRGLILAVQDVMGRNGLNPTLKLAGVPHYISYVPPANSVCEAHASEYAAIIHLTKAPTTRSLPRRFAMAGGFMPFCSETTTVSGPA